MRPTIRVLQLGRAIAVLAVVLHHAARASSDHLGALPGWQTAVFDRGYLGVDFFFVLSGFIIAWTNAEAEPGRRWARRYTESRLLRIFAPYWPVGLAMAAAYTLLPQLSASDRTWSWMASVTLLPAVEQPALIVAWTLQHELAFYGLFLLFALTRRPMLAASIWGAVIVGMTIFGAEPAGPWEFLFGTINLGFVMGMVAAAIVTSGRTRLAAVLGGTAPFLLLIFLAAGAQEVHRLLFAAALASVIPALIILEHRGRIGIGAGLLLLGEASYAIYLIHSPVMSLIARLLPDRPILGMLVLALAGTLAGLGYHLLFETPALRLARQLLGNRDRRDDPPPDLQAPIAMLAPARIAPEPPA